LFDLSPPAALETTFPCNDKIIFIIIIISLYSHHYSAGGKPSPILVAKLVEQCVLLASDGSGSAAALHARLNEQLQRSPEYKKVSSPRDCDKLGSHTGLSSSTGSA
jgi:hypothetical protein